MAAVGPTIAEIFKREELQDLIGEFLVGPVDISGDWSAVVCTSPLLHSLVKIRAPWQAPFAALVLAPEGR